MLFTVCKSERIQVTPGTESHTRHYKIRYLATELFEIPICLLGFTGLNVSEHNRGQEKAQHKSVNLLRYLLGKNSGLILLMAIGLWFVHNHYENIRQAEAMIASPQVNDLYFADLHRINPRFDPVFRYSLLQVDNVEGDRLTVKIGSILHTSPLSPFQYLTKGAYSGDSLLSGNTFEMSTHSLQTFYDEGIFYNMKRPEGELIDGWLSTRFLHDRDCEMCNSLRYK